MTSASAAITTAFIPVRDPLAAARWYTDAFGLDVTEATEFSSVLAGSQGQVTLMGPASGIRVEPGLGWATCNFRVDDVTSARERFTGLGAAPSEVLGDPARCLFFTAVDPDGNTLLITDR
ncbi:VOC family protein [Microbacterium kyungheense]|uniref:Catechol 2,3-dioxygenase-like lactoylglutathione lyase family enzyme n=1 Tax=Microbacterium kyungheense TaxID=1263636 RepID=A0A543ES07_9MICO|nr:VOC family protein [Microbacterium kyungheense]TQM24356.1 catechol 2,3-dioxygenase-like lactoylglutathione lyase family enzyme [Microbacterium kyungheense]